MAEYDRKYPVYLRLHAALAANGGEFRSLEQEYDRAVGTAKQVRRLVRSLDQSSPDVNQYPRSGLMGSSSAAGSWAELGPAVAGDNLAKGPTQAYIASPRPALALARPVPHTAFPQPCLQYKTVQQISFKVSHTVGGCVHHLGVARI